MGLLPSGRVREVRINKRFLNGGMAEPFTIAEEGKLRILCMNVQIVGRVSFTVTDPVNARNGEIIPGSVTLNTDGAIDYS